MIGGLGKIGGQSLWLLVNKGYNEDSSMKLQDGKSEGYRKRCAWWKWQRSLVFLFWRLLILGCLSRAGSGRTRQGEAIARNIFEMVRLKVYYYHYCWWRCFRWCIRYREWEIAFICWRTLGIL
jgi:acetyl-CoA carboxylase alpha subunit